MTKRSKEIKKETQNRRLLIPIQDQDGPDQEKKRKQNEYTTPERLCSRRITLARRDLNSPQKENEEGYPKEARRAKGIIIITVT
jgi:hypothetical protein